VGHGDLGSRRIGCPSKSEQCYPKADPCYSMLSQVIRHGVGDFSDFKESMSCAAE
jgi:hypothetical protein